MSNPGTPPAGVAPRRSDRSPWNWLLVLPIVVPLLVPLYNRIEPTLFGWPFFYWFQVLMVALGVGTTSIVYLATKRPTAERLAAERAVERDGGR